LLQTPDVSSCDIPKKALPPLSATRSRKAPALPEDSLALALRLAATVIGEVLRGRNLDVALTTAAIPPITRPAVMDLAYGALRSYGRGDALIRPLLQSPLKDADIRGLLLAALHRIERRPRDVHTTVDQAVTAAAGLARGNFKALVNGVLRNFLRRQDELTAVLATNEEARWQHPAWWIDALRRGWPRNYEQILAAGNTHPPMTLRANQRQVKTTDYLARLGASGIPARLLDADAIRLERPVAVEHLPSFFEGAASVQDAGAQWAARLLDAENGMRVLDACAAPGGKSAHILERANVDLLALDTDPRRSARIGDNLQRLGLKASVRAVDCRKTGEWWDGRAFDRILADVPCSASGVVRRHPDAKWLRRPGDVAGFASTQREILEALWPLLAPGGRMLYCTCSVFVEENAAQMEAFCKRHQDAMRRATHPDGAPDFYLMPNEDHDGFYYALLEKTS
jgi:16S rRNA (cytosine967-C5)-methyltransferase